MQLGQPNPLGHPPNPPEPDSLPLDLTSPTVGPGSALSNPTPHGSGAGFTFRNPWHLSRTETIILSGKILRILDQIWGDLARSRRYPTKSRLDFEGFSQIWPDFALAMKLETQTDTTWNRWTWTEKSDRISRVGFGSNVQPPESFELSLGWA